MYIQANSVPYTYSNYNDFYLSWKVQFSRFYLISLYIWVIFPFFKFYAPVSEILFLISHYISFYSVFFYIHITTSTHFKSPTIIPKIKRTNETLNVEVIRAFRKEIRFLIEAFLFLSLFFSTSMHLIMWERTSVNNYFDIIIPSLFFISESKRIVLAQILCKIKSISLNSLLLFTYFNKFYLNLWFSKCAAVFILKSTYPMAHNTQAVA